MQKIESQIVIGVPIYNEGAYILETLRSLAAQTHGEFKVLVADNASTDATEQVCRTFCATDKRFTYVRHASNLGALENFRYCLENSDSEFFMWLGGHDQVVPEFLAETLARMQADDSVSLVYGHTSYIDELGRPLAQTNGGNYIFDEPLQAHERYLKLLRALYRCEPVNQLIRRSCIDFSFRPVISADLAFLCHLAGHGPFARVEKPLYVRREISKRDSTPMERLTGQKSEAKHHELAALFVDSIVTHPAIDPARKPQLISQVLEWMDQRFKVFSAPSAMPAVSASAPSAASGTAPFFSVVMPMYNRERYVKEAIDSVLTQSDADFELIVVDDGSTDRSLEIVERIDDPRLRLLRNQHGGGAAARNTGIKAARGEFIVWIDSDDKQARGALAALRKSIASVDADIFYGDLEIFDEEQSSKQVLHTHYPDYLGRDVLPLLIQGNCLPNPGTAVRRDLYVRHGGYDTTFTRCHDYQIWTRLADTARFKKVDAILCHWRQHGESLSSAKTRAFEAKVILDAFARYPVSRLFPDLADDIRGQAEACQRVSGVLQQLQEYSPALRLAYKARALGHTGGGLAELEKLAGAGYEPAFSIILTTYNRPDLLRDALSSVGRQTLQDFEVILINDNGEPVEHLLADYDFPISYIRQGRNRGLSAARNAGLKQARGRYVVYLDDDDIYLPNHLAVLAEAFEQHPQSVVYTGVEYVSERLEGGRRVELGRNQPFQHEVFDRDRLFAQNYIPVNTWAHPREMLVEVGEFDTELAAFEDWDMLLRLATRYPFVHVPTVTTEVHTREVGAGADHMLGRERKNFPALYKELYRRYSGSSSEGLQHERRQMLARLGERPSKSSLERWLAERLPTETENRLISEYLQAHGGGPLIGVVVLDLDGQSDKLMATLKSLSGDRCIYSTLKIIVLTPSTTPTTSAADKLHFIRLAGDDLAVQINRAVEEADFEWFMLAQAGDEFTPSGLMIAGLELLASPECRAVYGDQLQRLPDGSLGGAFLPGFNLDLLLSFPLVAARYWLFRRDLFISMGGFDAQFAEALEFELITRLIEQDGLVGLGHIDEPLLITAAPALRDNPDERRVIERHLANRGYQARVLPGLPARYRVDYGHSTSTLVSVLIAADVPLARLQRCLDSLLEKTNYPHYEILLVDCSADAETQAWLQAVAALGDTKLRVVNCAAPAQALNAAAAAAQGEYLLLLSGESAVMQENWLGELLNHAQRPEVGIVGAKLLTADGRIDQAGLLLGLGGPASAAFAGEPLSAAGYMQRLQVDQDYSAVGEACLMVRAEVFRQLGGLDTDMGVYRDVDLCLRMRDAGYLTVWAAHAAVLHEGQPRQASVDEQDKVYQRHLPALARDPAYNRNLALSGRGFDLESDTGLTWRPLTWRPLPVVLAHPADPWGCGNYRMIKPFSALKEAGLVDGMMSMGLLQVPDLERFDPDVIVLQRQIGDERLEAMRRIREFSRAFTVYELDDYLPNLPLKSAHRSQMPRDILKSLRRGLDLVDRFVVSTAPLAEAFAGLHGDIRVVKNYLPTHWWGDLQGLRRQGRKARVGWAGGVGHTGDLEMIADVVKELAGEVEWVFFGMCPEKLRPFVHEIHQGVDIDQYPKALAALNLDLALAPVEQNLFNDCKSNLRLLEYGACGFPVVCSEVRCYQDDNLPVTRVKNRFKDWVDAIRMHINDLDAAARAGDQLREAVHRDWMLSGENLLRWRKGWTPD
ncbi:glycosyltransferase [Pseudomonas sp. F(2018)]|uniref:glycosyltransferase n=1 Tax=Pseudomonas sp. F(2018) TaxID=2502240 RepID=UPI0010F7901B|nr:glycosyltransferase [Pseudomonas sp. F(2018)]